MRSALRSFCSPTPDLLPRYHAAAFAAPDDEQRDVVALLLAAGCKPSASDDLDGSILARAFVSSSASIARMLLHSGAVMWPHEKTAVIDTLCRHALPLHMQLLLQHSQQLEMCELLTAPCLQRMLHTAARAVFECSELVELLLARGAHVDARDSRGFTPLMAACSGAGCDSVIETLVARGADVNLVSASGTTALLLLCRERAKLTSRAVAVLLDAGAIRTLKCVDAVTKQSCLHYLAMRSGVKQQHLHDQRQVYECVARLTSAGADTRLLDVQGRNCLHYAYMNGTLKAYNVPLLLLQVCLKDEVTHKDVYGKVPKDYEPADLQRAAQQPVQDDAAPAADLRAGVV
jgi:hypothetical protein